MRNDAAPLELLASAGDQGVPEELMLKRFRLRIRGDYWLNPRRSRHYGCQENAGWPQHCPRHADADHRGGPEDAGGERLNRGEARPGVQKRRSVGGGGTVAVSGGL
jgi:hypothetical protein